MSDTHVPESVVNLQVPVDKLELIYKAVKPQLPGGTRESKDFFAQQNNATKTLSDIVSESYDAMVKSLTKEISEVFEEK